MWLETLKLLAFVLVALGIVLILAVHLGCARVGYDSDRNIANMSADELRRELVK